MTNSQLPQGFIYLKEIDFNLIKYEGETQPIVEDIRYSTIHNFTGRPINGYFGSDVIVSISMGEALKKLK